MFKNYLTKQTYSYVYLELVIYASLDLTTRHLGNRYKYLYSVSVNCYKYFFFQTLNVYFGRKFLIRLFKEYSILYGYFFFLRKYKYLIENLIYTRIHCDFNYHFEIIWGFSSKSLFDSNIILLVKLPKKKPVQK